MDPTLAALAGALIGMAGAVAAPTLTARHARKARRREVMREAYAEGMRAISDVARVRNLDDYRTVRERIFESQIQIRLVGSRRTSLLYDDVVTVVEQFLALAAEEAPKFKPFTNPMKRALDAIPESLQAEVGETHAKFIFAARRDIDMEDPAWLRAWRNGRRKLRSSRNRQKTVEQPTEHTSA